MKFYPFVYSLILLASGIRAAPAAQRQNEPDRGPPPPPPPSSPPPPPSPPLPSSPPPPTVGLVNFWNGGGCAPSSSPCNVDFPIHETGCYTVPPGCSTSATVIGMIPGCTLSIWTDDNCSNYYNVIEIGGNIGQCEQPGPQVGSISAVCT